MTQLGTAWTQTMAVPQVRNVDKTCDTCELFGHDEHTERLITRNGQSQIQAFCRRCEYASLILPHSGFTPEQINAMPIWKNNSCTDCGGVGCKECGWEPCAKCGGFEAIEIHHWAPRHLFGNNFWHWPTSPLCRACHRLWHSIVTPDMHKRRAS